MSTINVKVQTLASAQNLGRINDLLGKSLSRLSSGTRITSPSTDPAAVGSIGKLDALHKRTEAAAINVQNAASFVQSTAGFISSLSGVLTRMAELTQFASDSMKTPSDIALYQSEFKQLQDQLRQTIGGTTAEIGGTTGVPKPLGVFNGISLFGPNATGLSVASSAHAGDNIVIKENNLRDGAMLALFQQDAGGNYLLSSTDVGATKKVSDGLDELADERSILGGEESRLDLAAGSLTVASQNITAAVSRIQDVDVATESTRLSKLNTLLQSGAAMLSQANQSPRSVLQLLKA